MESKYVSIIVPTYMDWERLSLCVESLSKQSYSPDLFEVIIVNNNPQDPVPVNFTLPENFKIIIESKSGSYAARNAALKIAKGEIIGFTDSDCIADKNWISNALSYFDNNKSCSRIAGNIVIFFKDVNPTIAELYNALYSFPQRTHVEKSNSSVTGNLFVYRKIFDAVGLFNERLLSLGDLEWGRLAHKAGYKVHYVENVIINHPARNLAELIKKEKRVGGGQGIRERGKKKKIKTLLNFLNGCRPRIEEFKFVYKYGKGIGTLDKLKVIFLRHHLLNVRAIENLKVQMGKNPNRA